MQILQTDLYTLNSPWRIRVREFDNRSKHFPFADHFFNSHTFSLGFMLIVLEENCIWSRGEAGRFLKVRFMVKGMLIK